MNEETKLKADETIANLIAQTAKLNAQTAKITRENVYYPLIVGASVTLAIVATVKIFL